MTFRRTVLGIAATIGALVLAGCAPQSVRDASASPSDSRTMSPTATPSPTPTLSCAARIVDGLTPDEQAGQLIIVGLGDNEDPTLLDDAITRYHLAGVVLLGGWDGGMSVARTASTHLQSLAGPATGGLGLLIAADQEGGDVQQLRGEGFTAIPSAVQQGALDPATLAAQATVWAAELRAAGINLNLAPVADTVPADLGRGNPPIGGLNRQFSSDPTAVASHVVAVVDAMAAAGVGTTIKHFPGLGRVTGNTDFTASGTADDVTTSTDAYLQPFAAGIAAGVPAVMISSAIYTQIDPTTEAVFSAAVITSLLRGQVGFDGVVISDDIGVAASVASTPVTDRATAFVGAGGDLALTADPAAVGPFHDSLVAAMADPAFAAKVTDAATRVVQLKVDLGLATCG
ncbi:glycoside hydrolase family 3 N-terminal domain-containing protein [Microbacterium sp. P01]|uniref:glycoside hydrolase family 3 N-terminal domain-containing protein n=1 Tax=unclassified Microbacterium TaxID=2609290 RepID=UPI00366EA049